MNWKNIIQDLVDSGMTRSEIARSCGVSSARITNLMKGGSTVAYEVGDRLVSMWKLRVKNAA